MSCAKNLEDHNKGRRHMNNLKKMNQKKKLYKNLDSETNRDHFTPDDSYRYEKHSRHISSREVSNRYDKHQRYKSNDYHRDHHSRSYRLSHKNHNYHYNNNHFSNDFQQAYPNNFQNYENDNHGWKPMIEWNNRNEFYPPCREPDYGYNPMEANFNQNVNRPNRHQVYEDPSQNVENNYMVNSEQNIICTVNFSDPCKNSTVMENSASYCAVEPQCNQKTDKLPATGAEESANSTEHLIENPSNVINSVGNTDKLNNQSFVIDSSSDIEKQSEKKTTISENMTGKRIAHWIKPSNMKDKAEVMRLVNEFSKSKKKENLLKLKLQTDSTSNDNRYGENEVSSNEPFSVFPSSNNNEETNSISSIETPSSDMTSQEPSTDSTVNLPSKRKKHSKRKSSADSIILPTAGHESLSNSDIISTSNGTSSCTVSSSSSIGCPSKKAKRKASDSSQGISSGSSVLNEVCTQRKRKDSTQSKSNPNKHQCSSAECLTACINEVASGGGTCIDLPAVQESTIAKSNPKEVPMTTTNTLNVTEDVPQVPVKQEIYEFDGDLSLLPPSVLEAFTVSEMTNKQYSDNVCSPEGATMSPVESLINLFASGTVKVKKEFDDPVIDVLRTVDPSVLDKVCVGQTSHTVPNININQNSVSNNSAIQNPSTTNNLPQFQREIVNSHNVNNASSTQFSTNNLQSLKNSLNDILQEIQSNSSIEEKVKRNIDKSDHKIQEYQALLDEWRTKKMKYLSEEEVLRKRRNELLKAMTNLLQQQNAEKASLDAAATSGLTLGTSSGVPDRDPTNALSKTQAFHPEKQAVCDKPRTSQELNKNTSSCPSVDVKNEVEEIAFLPVCEKSNDIPVIDIADVDVPTTVPDQDRKEAAAHTEVILEKFAKEKDISAHSVSINSIQVYENYLYTCSNDGTAKRFDLSDYTNVVTYLHQRKNVTQLCVEKIRDINLVFTTTSGSKQISIFKAEDGVLFKIFNFNCTVASICKGKGLVYAGLRNGSILACNWKEHREIVNVAEPIRSIDTTCQGRLNVLVTLSVNGNVSIRDAERNGLLIRYVKARSYVPLFMTVCSDSIYLSSAGVLTVLDIATGRFVTKYSFSAPYTSLAVYRHNIFTASFSGIVRCYSKDEVNPVEMYYGAGKTAITCITVYQGWVFTGNRFGQVSAFKYDPSVTYPCQVGSCDNIFPQHEDLEYHILMGSDHDWPAAGSLCSWRQCQLVIPKKWSNEAIKAHLKSHISS